MIFLSRPALAAALMLAVGFGCRPAEEAKQAATVEGVALAPTGWTQMPWRSRCGRR